MALSHGARGAADSWTTTARCGAERSTPFESAGLKSEKGHKVLQIFVQNIVAMKRLPSKRETNDPCKLLAMITFWHVRWIRNY